MFAARDHEGRVCIYNKEPIYWDQDFMEIDKSLLPEILPGTFREVELIIKKD